MTISSDILAVLESTKLPLTISDIIQDVAVMPVARGEPRRNVEAAIIRSEVRRLVYAGVVIESSRRLTGYGTELVYRMKVDEKPTQRNLL